MVLETSLLMVDCCGCDDGRNTEQALLDCCEWVAHGIELVQSPYAGWKFQTPDTICAGGLHGAFLLAERCTVTPDLLAQLRDFKCTLIRDGSELETGHSTNVLDGPLNALGHLVELLSKDTTNPPLARGEIITTGTLTDAYAINAGETWQTRLEGLDLATAHISFV